MPNTESLRIAPYRRHKASWQAVVTLNGKDHYLGRYNSAASREAYNRIIQEWLTAGRRLLKPDASLTVNELILAYWRMVEGSFAPTVSGHDPGELHCLRTALRLVRELYGRTAASAFGRLAPQGRPPENDREELAPRLHQPPGESNSPMVPLGGLRGNDSGRRGPRPPISRGLRRGKSTAREKDPVKRVLEDLVKAVLPFLSPAVCAMVELQWHTGMRPGEVLGLRACDLDATCKV